MGERKTMKKMMTLKVGKVERKTKMMMEMKTLSMMKTKKRRK
jgi:hypothetical protein